MGPYGLGDGALVAALGRLWPPDAGQGRGADRTGRRTHAGAPPLSYRWVEGLYGGAAAGRGGRVSASASGQGGPQAQASAGGSAAPVVCPSGQGPRPSRACRGGPPACRLRWSAPFWQAVAPAPAWHDDPDGLHGTLVWHLAWTRRAPAAPYPVSVLESHAPSGEGLARRQPVQLRDAA